MFEAVCVVGISLLKSMLCEANVEFAVALVFHSNLSIVNDTFCLALPSQRTFIFFSTVARFWVVIFFPILNFFVVGPND